MAKQITLSSKYYYTANITAYNPVTKVVTLDQPVNISYGSNSLLTGDGQAYDISSRYTINGTITNIAKAINAGTNLPTLSTDEAGNFVGIFNVPPNTFQTGTRVFRIDNRVGSDPTSATTYAEASFFASGLATTSQQLDFAPSVDSSSTSFVQTSQLSNQLISTVTTYSPYDPVAQTFLISKDNYPNGIFLKSVKLFFASKPSTNSTVTVSILPTINGYPGGTELQYSKVTLTPDKVKVSTAPHYLDPTSYTEFDFDAPVYIQPGVLYAIKVTSNSTDYTLYYAQQNQTAITSTAKNLPSDPTPVNPTKIGSAPYIGALFESQNSITWTADQTKDLMFVIDKCVFTQTTAKIPFVVPQNLPYRKMATQDIIHKLDANSASHIHGNYSKNRLMDAFNVSTTDFIPTGANVAYSYQSTLLNGNVPTAEQSVTPGRFGTPAPDTNYLSDGQGERALIRYSSNSFSLYATMSTSDPNVSPIISDDGVSLYSVKYLINNMGIGNNVISITNPGNGYSNPVVTITPASGDTGTGASAVAVANGTGAITSIYVVNPGSGYTMTPTISITGSNTATATAVVTGETSPKGGNAYAKYFTKKVILTPGNDSGDLRVFYTAYRPVGTNIYVYYKILSSQDTLSFDTNNWQLMTTIKNNTTYSTNRNDLYEFESAPGINNQANNSIAYTNINGQTYNNFIQFAIKVVLATSDNTNPPFLTDIRALALPPGTGI